MCFSNILKLLAQMHSLNFPNPNGPHNEIYIVELYIQIFIIYLSIVYLFIKYPTIHKNNQITT